MHRNLKIEQSILYIYIYIYSFLYIYIVCYLAIKRTKWVCREALFSLVTPGHLLSPSLFLDYRHLVDYILYAQSIPFTRRDTFVSPWHRTRHYRWGPFWRLVTASKSLGMHVEDRFVFVFQSDSVSVDEPLPVLTHLIRDSYRQLLLPPRSMKRRIDCSGPISQVSQYSTYS